MKYSEIKWATHSSHTFSFRKACCGIKSNNRYEVKDDTGNNIFRIIEDNDCCNRTYCGAARSFTMNVFNDSNQEIIRLVRPFVCSCCSHEVWPYLCLVHPLIMLYCICDMLYVYFSWRFSLHLALPSDLFDKTGMFAYLNSQLRMNEGNQHLRSQDRVYLAPAARMQTLRWCTHTQFSTDL